MTTIATCLPRALRHRGARAIGRERPPYVPYVFAAVLCLPTFQGLAGNTIAVQALPSAGSDSSVGTDGTAWLIGCNPYHKDRELYRWTGSGWEDIAGRGTRIAVDPQGNAWVLDGDGSVKHWENGGWSEKPGTGTDIAVGRTPACRR